jgi:hypothetical protein
MARGSAKNGAPVGLLGMRSTSDWPVAFEFSMESQRESGNIGNWGCVPRLARTATTSFGSLLGRPLGRSSALWMPPANYHKVLLRGRTLPIHPSLHT